MCPHCGAEHRETTCPATGQSVLDPGPCGTRVDRYEVLARIGGGGFGTVYRARHVHTLRPVAIKLIDRAHVRDVATLERFKREAQIATTIASPHVVLVLDWGIQPSGQAFLVMELLEGRDLAAVLAGGPLAPARALDLAGQILAAVAAVHAAGAIHRDIKPGNIFLARISDRDVVKLLDFGCGRAEYHNAQLTRGATLGTPQYMAPEQMRAGPLDARADVYATAVVVYEMLAGRRPHEGASYEDLVARVCTEPPKPLAELVPDLPAHATSAIMRGLERDPELRWASAAAFARALQGDPASAETLPAAPIARRHRPTRRPRWIWLAAVGAAAAIAVSFVVWQAGGSATKPPAPGPAPGAACTYEGQCPTFLCQCTDEPLRAGGCGRDGHCLTAAFCQTTCLDAGGGGSDYEVANPTTTADCEAAPACRTHGRCVARIDATDTFMYCVTGCRDLGACKYSGICTDAGGDRMTCVATSDADCKASRHCRTVGYCSLVNGACAVASDADCAISEPCRDDGRCKASNGSCL